MSLTSECYLNDRRLVDYPSLVLLEYIKSLSCVNRVHWYSSDVKNVTSSRDWSSGKQTET